VGARIKICGITNPSDAMAAIAAGADAIGFITHPQSPRFVDLEKEMAWIKALPPFVMRVAVSVNVGVDQVRRWRALGIADAFQLHGDESRDYAASLAPARVIKVLRPKAFIPLADLQPWECEAFLLDTPGPSYGGTGQACDWQVAAAIVKESTRATILAGGLTPDNVAAAIRAVRPYAVDASSGLELKPGKKDHAKMRDFVQAAKAALD